MGNPAYDARREAERLQAERDKKAAELGILAVEMIGAFLAGKASIQITHGVNGHNIRLVRDP